MLLADGPIQAMSVANIPMISIVDDDVWSRNGLEDLVLSLGTGPDSNPPSSSCSPAASGTDCLITDLRMPGWSGLELQSHLRRAERSIPISSSPHIE